MRQTAREFAEENDILYVPIRSREIVRVNQEESSANSLLLVDGRYIILHPPNDGMPTCPFVFYQEAKDGKYLEVIDNHSAFQEITNLPEVLLKMTKLYEKHIDNPVFLDPMCFALMLVDPIDGRYHGRGELAITDDTLCNNNVPPEKQRDARRHFYNEFLDRFIGWNFGKAVSESAELSSSLAHLVELLNAAGLRQNAGPGFGVWGSKDVWHVKYTNDGTPAIIRF